MEHPDESVDVEVDEWAARSLDESERRLRASDRDDAMAGVASTDLGAAGGAAVIVALLHSVGRWLQRVIRRDGH